MLLKNSFNLFTKIFNKFRFIKRKETNDVMTFAFIIMKFRYDAKYLTFNFRKKDEIFLKLHYKYFISDSLNRKLFQ